MRTGTNAVIPTALKLMEGNPGKKKLPVDEPEPVFVPPTTPDELYGYARAEWEKISLGLFHMKLLSEVDTNALAAYCNEYRIWRQAVEALNEIDKSDARYHGLMIETSNGNWVQNPLIGAIHTAAREMLRYAQEFGLTPVARAKMGMRNIEKPQNKFGSSLLGGKS